jgi:hypothetical protein
MRGELSTGRFSKRHPLDWYVEQGWEWGQIAAAIGVEPELSEGVTIWDPCCGYGHCGSWLEQYGFEGRIVLSDVVNNVAWDDFIVRPHWFAADFRDLTSPPVEKCSIWCNPPYSYQPGIAEQFVRHALRLATHRVVMLLPNKWLAPGVDVKAWSNRSRLFRRDHPPKMVLHFSQRPSMPPGDRIHLMGGRAYHGGMVDYCAIVWDVRHPTAHGERARSGCRRWPKSEAHADGRAERDRAACHGPVGRWHGRGRDRAAPASPPRPRASDRQVFRRCRSCPARADGDDVDQRHARHGDPAGARTAGFPTANGEHVMAQSLAEQFRTARENMELALQLGCTPREAAIERQKRGGPAVGSHAGAAGSEDERAAAAARLPCHRGRRSGAGPAFRTVDDED